MHRLAQGGITDDVINAAVASFVLETIVQHGPPADVLCNKDPLAFKQGQYLSKLFPKSKWIFMVRDGRAVIHSVIKRFIFILFLTFTVSLDISPEQSAFAVLCAARRPFFLCLSHLLSHSLTFTPT
jgi:hypothetical protein